MALTGAVICGSADIYKPEHQPKSEEGGGEEQQTTETNPLILFPYQAALNLPHSY